MARYHFAKRVMDVSVAAVLLLCLLPILIVCAVLIRFDSPGPLLFRQPRMGERGKRFTMLKFRSMYVNADATLHRDYTAAFIRGTAQAQQVAGRAVFKLADDPRVTRVGRWLRRTSLDELPQLWNVLRGEMSLVGPRPPLWYEAEHYQPAHLERLSVKPGITGLWQVSGRSATTFEEMVALDRTYIQNRSVAMDLRILLKTIPVVLLARDAT